MQQTQRAEKCSTLLKQVSLNHHYSDRTSSDPEFVECLHQHFQGNISANGVVLGKLGSSGATLGVGGNWGPITRLSLWDLCHTNLLMATCFATKSCKCVNLSSLSARLGWNQFSSKDVRRCRSLSGLGSIWRGGGPCLGRQRVSSNQFACPSY